MGEFTSCNKKVVEIINNENVWGTVIHSYNPSLKYALLIRMFCCLGILTFRDTNVACFCFPPIQVHFFTPQLLRERCRVSLFFTTIHPSIFKEEMAPPPVGIGYILFTLNVSKGWKYSRRYFCWGQHASRSGWHANTILHTF